MKIHFVGHSHHRVTLSSRFFTELLERNGHVEYHWDDTWQGSSAQDLATSLGDGELIVVWQSVTYLKRLAPVYGPKIVYVPMYDASRTLRRSFWERARDIRILNFSSTLHQRVQHCGARRSAYFQYFPDPGDHAPSTDFTRLRGFFWQRQARPCWSDIERLIRGAEFESLHLHMAPDPGVTAPPAPTDGQIPVERMDVSTWFPQRAELFDKLRAANVYFAPRLDEGIGLAFLEAMAMGMAVCAPRRPTHSEYICDRIDGLLYDLDSDAVPDWRIAGELGRRARATIEKGHARWRADQDRLHGFLFDADDCRRHIHFAHPVAAVPDDSLATGEIAPKASNPPRVTIATVVRNAAAELDRTLASVIAQSYADKEIVVIDGASTDGTLDVLSSYGDQIDRWHSEPDLGPYDAMNKAADAARGNWIMYIHAGDHFVDSGALERLIAGVSDEPDFVIAHHAYLGADGCEAIHRCVDFEQTYEGLLDGATTAAWLAGIPGHQAVMTRTELIRRHRYDLEYRIAADHEFMYRMRRDGARFHVEPVIVTQYTGGGLSWQHLFTCLAEWRAIALRYTERPERVEREFKRLHLDTMRLYRRRSAFDWRTPPAREHPLRAARVTAEHHLRSLLAWLDRTHARLRNP